MNLAKSLTLCALPLIAAQQEECPTDAAEQFTNEINSLFSTTGRACYNAASVFDSDISSADSEVSLEWAPEYCDIAECQEYISEFDRFIQELVPNCELNLRTDGVGFVIDYERVCGTQNQGNSTAGGQSNDSTSDVGQKDNGDDDNKDPNGAGSSTVGLLSITLTTLMLLNLF